MKKSFIFFPFLILFSLIALTSFNDGEDKLSAAYKTKFYVIDELETTRERVKDLYHAVLDQDVDKMRQALKNARIQYKMIEFYLESYESSKTRFINGPPQPWLEFVGSDTELTYPAGLQVLEEMIFDDSLDFDKIKTYTLYLNNELLIFKNTIEVNLTSDASIFLGLKYGLIGIEAVTLPSFDCDITEQVAEEGYSSLQTIYNVLNLYLDEHKDKPISKTIEATLKLILDAQDFLRPDGVYQDFETLDRLTFIKQHLQPINSAVVDIFESIKTEDKNTTLRVFRYYLTHINGYIKNMYEPDFIDRVATSERGYYDINGNEKIQPEIIALGKKLFNDKRLSKGNKLSCSTCHEEHLAFTDGQKTSFTNIDGVFQKRNSPTLTYSTYSRRLFSDFRSHTLEDQVVHVVNNPDEFDTTFEEIIDKLNQDSVLIKEFTKAFPEDWKKPIKEFTIRKALAQYVRSLSKFDSEFDAYMRGEIDDIDDEVKRGFNLFMGKAKCGTCHFAPTFAGLVPPLYRESETEVLGMLEQWDTIHPVLTTDSGRYDFQKNPIYIGSHKTPTVRNVQLTAPYMHNGAFKDLETVMDFYNRGGGAGMGLKVDNQTLDDAPLNLNEQEISDIIAFMNSLTDRYLLEKFNAVTNKK